MSKRVLLLTAPRPEPGYSPVHFGDNRPPQGLGYLSAFLEQNNHTTKIVDLYAFGGDGFTNNAFVSQEEIGQQLDIDIDQTINEFRPDFIGMYVHTMSFESACALSLYLRQAFPSIKQVCGGPHPTLMPESIPDTFDFVVSGEGEYALVDIVEGRVSSRFTRGKRLSSEELENLSWPDFDHFWQKPYNWSLKLFNQNISPVFTICTSRGCPFHCRFCGVKKIYPKYICISAEHLFKRMRYLHSKYHVSIYYFREDNFTAHLGRLDRFCELIIDSGIDFKWVCESRVRELSCSLIAKMAEAGCIGLYIGCESGSSKVLETMRKDESVEDYLEKFPVLHKHGIATYTTWVYGTPGESSEDRRLTDELIKHLNPVSVDRFVFIGIPISDFYEEIVREGKFEFMDKNGFMYPKGYLSLASHLYGPYDPRVSYVRNLYKDHDVKPIDVDW
jgi:radical SAM superfamily enzyme YgiQ (UPF0313 family)